jgi:hypothetical protein
MKLIAATLTLLAATTSAHALSAAGNCHAAEFHCDHVTVSHLDDGRVLLQFTEYAGHYMSFVGRADSEADTLVHVDESYLDGLSQSHADGQCSLVFKAPGELVEVICPSLTFTVKKDSK